MTVPPARTAYIIRRQSTGGGAEKAAERLTKHISATWSVHHLFAGMPFGRRVIAGSRGPGWWRAMRFARSVDVLLRNRPGVVLSLERGPDCHVYRAGDGVHLRWRSLRFGASLAWMANPLHWFYPSLEAKTVAAARFVAANSNMVRRELEEYYPRAAHKLRVIRNGFDPNLFMPDPAIAPRTRNVLGLADPCRLFLFVGSGWKRKGLDRALELVAGYNQVVGPNEPRGVLVVIGKGSQRRYAAQLRSLNLEGCVRFLGIQAQVHRYYQAADVLLLPTLYDPFANVCLEALACGCPVITTPNNGASELLDHGRTGFLLGDDLPDAIAWCRTARPEPQEVHDSVAQYSTEREAREFSALMEECALPIG